MATHHDEGGVVRALIAGILANFGVAVAKFVAFLFTSSAAMLAEAVHSLADSSNQALLLLGMRRAARPATQKHPFGYNVERYFWSFVVAVNIFVLGAVVAIYEGIEKIRHPHPMDEVWWNYAALAVGAMFEAYALSVAWKEFQHWRRENDAKRAGRPKKSLMQSLVDAKDLSLPTVLFEDTAALLGLSMAAIGIFVADRTGNGVYDGIASVCIGVVLLFVAAFLARESHSLLVGEAAGEVDREAIREAVEEDDAVLNLVEAMTLHRGPHRILVALTIEFDDALQADAIEESIRRIEARIRERVPAARDIFIEAGSLKASRSS